MRAARAFRFHQAVFACFIVAAGTRPSDAFPEERTTPADLKTPARITGRVVEDANGKPVAGAEVFVLLPAPEGGRTYYWPLPLKQTKTDENGEFAYETSRSGRHLVWANRGKLTSRKKPLGGEKVVVETDGTSPKAIELLVRPAVAVRVTVSDEADGRSLPKATVHLGWSDLDDFQTDEQGAANVEPLPPQRWFFEIWAEGYAKQAHWLNLEAGNDAELAVSLRPGAVVEGVVRGADDKPLAAAEVGASVEGKRDLYWTSQRTDEKGRFELDSLPEGCALSFSKQGYSSLDDEQLPLDGEGLVNVVLSPQGVIRGKVIDARSGRPVRSFQVRLDFSPQTSPNDPSAGIPSDLIEPGQAFQSDDGTFELSDLLLRMPLQVMVDAEGYERGVNERVESRVADEAEPVVFRLMAEDPANLVAYRGRFVDAQGNPVAGAQLRLLAVDQRDARDRNRFPFNWTMIHNGQVASQSGVRRFLQAATGKDGAFRFERIPVGADTELIWWGRGIAPGRRSGLEKLAGRERETIQIVLEPPALIIGKVDRTAFPEASQVVLHAATRELMDYMSVPLADGQETFELPDLAAGRYTVALMGPLTPAPRGMGMTSQRIDAVQVDLKAGERKEIVLNGSRAAKQAPAKTR